MALDMFQKQIQRNFRTDYTLIEFNRHICAEVRQRESNIISYNALCTIFYKRQSKIENQEIQVKKRELRVVKEVMKRPIGEEAVAVLTRVFR
jgi:hypothetical protein